MRHVVLESTQLKFHTGTLRLDWNKPSLQELKQYELIDCKTYIVFVTMKSCQVYIHSVYISTRQ